MTTPKAFLRVDFLQFVHVVPSFRSLTRPPDESLIGSQTAMRGPLAAARRGAPPSPGWRAVPESRGDYQTPASGLPWLARGTRVRSPRRRPPRAEKRKRAESRGLESWADEPAAAEAPRSSARWDDAWEDTWPERRASASRGSRPDFGLDDNGEPVDRAGTSGDAEWDEDLDRDGDPYGDGDGDGDPYAYRDAYSPRDAPASFGSRSPARRARR